jgi:hypothetical protein
MKTYKVLSVIGLVVFGWMTSFGQAVEPEVPGDNFSLEGALELFKQSSSPEAFEKLLNSPDSKVNNLDLNGDGYIDYIRVQDRNEGNVHAFIIQAVISERELQDVAVITLEKLANGKAVLQIIGDEDIYGTETIIEPTQEVRTYAGSQSSRSVVNVWTWPSVQYVYSPYYAGWASPWGWYSRPIWWHAWRPVTYVHYYPIWRPYYRHYSVCYSPRVVYARNLYRPYRSTSIIVHDRHYVQVDRYRSNYRNNNGNDPGRRNDRSSYTNNDRRAREGVQAERRAESDRTRRSEVVEQTSDSHSSPSRERAMPAQRTYNREAGSEISSGRRATIPANTEKRREVITSPANNESRRHQMTTPSEETRSRSSRPEVEQRPLTRQQSVATDVQRNTSQMRRSEPPTARMEAPSRRAETRQADVRPAPSAPSRSSQERAAPQRSNNQPSSTRSGDARRGRQ